MYTDRSMNSVKLSGQILMNLLNNAIEMEHLDDGKSLCFHIAFCVNVTFSYVVL